MVLGCLVPDVLVLVLDCLVLAEAEVCGSDTGVVIAGKMGEEGWAGGGEGQGRTLMNN